MQPAPSSRRAALALLASALAGPALGQRRELRLLAGELPPYTFHEPPPTVSDRGAPMGIVHEAAREMAVAIGNSGAIEYLPWALAQDLAMRGPSVGILALTRTP